MFENSDSFRFTTTKNSCAKTCTLIGVRSTMNRDWSLEYVYLDAEYEYEELPKSTRCTKARQRLPLRPERFRVDYNKRKDRSEVFSIQDCLAP